MRYGKTKRNIYRRGTGAQSYAVNRYQRGERPSEICKSLGRSRSWLQKWVGRYNSL
ncbi:MAG: helix-turn-helix domain-containing protein, partial [Methanosarcinales archaeon]|nr:helix-turn-helix domain-containing protein [Methanosarcinales archaeon]